MDKLTRLLQEAITRQEYDSVWRLVDEGADVNTRAPDGQTPLMSMVLCGRTDAVKDFVMQRGARLEPSDSSGQTALHYAARKADPGPVKCLLSAGADVNARDKEHKTPLMLLGENCRDAAVEAACCLLEEGADVNARDSNGRTVVHHAAETLARGSDKFLERLLKAPRVEVDAASMHGATPLMLACQQGKKAAVRWLLAAHADPNAQDMAGRTPLIFTARGVQADGKGQIVAVLVAAGARLHTTDVHGDSVMEWAADGEGNKEVRAAVAAAAQEVGDTESLETAEPGG